MGAKYIYTFIFEYKELEGQLRVAGNNIVEGRQQFRELLPDVKVVECFVSHVVPAKE